MDNLIPLYKENSLAYIYDFIETFILQEIPEIKSVDLFFNQFYTSAIDPKATPRILVEIQPITIQNLLSGLYEAEVYITLHIGIEIYNTFYNGSELQNINFAYLNILEYIYTKLSKLSSYTLPDEKRNDNFLIHNLEMTGLNIATNQDNIKINKIDFRFIFENRLNYKQSINSNIISYNTVINL